MAAPQRRRLRRWIKVFSLLAAAGVVTVTGVYLYIAPTLPTIETIRDLRVQVPLRVFSRDGVLLAEYGEKRRAPLAYDEIPTPMVQAVLAAEDDRFFEHPGVDYQGILRAVFTLVTTGQKSQGGSTITMQVARNFFLSKEKTYLRKISEIFLSFRIEGSLSKEEILELYFNKIYFGNRAYGIAAAAQIYYGKPLAQLNVSQFAMIAGLPKAPSRFNPIINPKRATLRRNYVLRRMHELGFLDDGHHEEALAFRDDARLHGLSIELEAPYIGEMVRSEMVERFGDAAYTEGYRVYTTIDARLQKAANQALRKTLLNYNERHGYRGPLDHVEINLDAQAQEWIRALGELPAIRERLPDGSLEENLFDDFMTLGSLRLSMDQWDSLIRKTPEVGGLKPALVSQLEEKAVNLYMGEGQIARIEWNGLKWASKYENEHNSGPLPERASDILQVGDLIYVRKDDEGQLRLNYVPEVEGALVSLSPEDGAILALTGGFDFYHSKFNRVTQAERQPGSNFKPFIYSAALEKGYTAASIINDAPIVLEDSALESVWRPENYSGKFFGPTRLRLGLIKSRNLISIRLLRSIGIRYAIRHASRFGIPTNHLPRDLSLALGSGTVTPLDLATGYTVFANGGYRIEPYVIDRITDADEGLIYQNNPIRVCPECLEAAKREAEAKALEVSQPETVNVDIRLQDLLANDEEEHDLLAAESSLTDDEEILEVDEPVELPTLPAEQVLSPQNAYIMSSIMRDVIRAGTGRRARWELKRTDLAGKTGTTNDQLDAWFSGFNHAITTTTWVGFDKPRSMGEKETGARAALPMWIDYMREALRDIPELPLQQPEGMVTVRIDPETGLLADSSTRDAIFESFRSEHVPTAKTESTTPATEAESSTDSPQEGAIPEQLF